MSKYKNIKEPKNPEEFPTANEISAIINPYYNVKEKVNELIKDPTEHSSLARPYSQEEIDELLNSTKIKNLVKWLKNVPEDELSALDDVFAYPNNDNQYMHIPGQRNIEKWMQAIRDLLISQQNKIDNKSALSQVTAGWNPVEVRDFINWFRYYQEGAHLKYKFAQSYFYGNADIGYLIPTKSNLPKEEPPTFKQDIDFAKEDVNSAVENKAIIEKQRNKIIGRLDSAEKLLRSHEGQMFSGKEFESLLESIYDLKKRIQLINKRSLSTRLYEDLIVRQANILNKNGFIKAANVLYSVAEEKGGEDLTMESVQQPAIKPATEPAKPVTDTKAPPPASPAPPTTGSGAVGGLPANVPGSTAKPAESAPSNTAIIPKAQEESKSKGINDFFKNLKAPGSTDDTHADDVLEVEDHEELLTVEAQLAPEPVTETNKPVADIAPPPTDTPEIEVSEDEVKPTPNEKSDNVDKSTFDSKIDGVFQNLKVDDVVAKLEDLAKVFKTREIPRQLSIADMMLDSLGLASFFPSLSEATNKALESNNYISTRVEDIISKLRGAMATHDIDLKGGEAESRPDVAAIKNKLQSDTDKEKARKELRKQQENEELEQKTKETPDIEVSEDLEAPATPPAPATAPAKPPAV